MKKTKIIAFYKNGHIPKSLFYLGDQVVEKTKSYKYLGSIITNTGNFNLNEINLKKKGLRASYFISKIGVHAKPSSSIKIFEKWSQFYCITAKSLLHTFPNLGL